MDIVNSIYCNRDLNKPKDWDESKLGQCHSLPVMDYKDAHGLNFMVSFWKPDAEDLKKLNEGCSISLGVHANLHPVVFVAVSDIPV